MINSTGIPLKEILENSPLKGSNILAAEEGLSNLVTRVNVMVDLEIMNWANEGELLLTTGQTFAGIDIRKLLVLFEDFKEKKLSGICIKVKPYLEELPPAVVALADELDFPIIELDYDVSFTEIMTYVFKEIYEKQSNIIRKVETLHHDNMNIVLKGGTILDILKSVSKTADHPIFVVDHHFEEIYFDESKKNIDYASLKKNISEYFGKAKANKIHSKNSFDKIVVGDQTVDRLSVPIVVKNGVYGHIIVFGIDGQLGNFEQLAMESISNIIALEFLKKLSVQEVENKYKTEFFEDLISLDIKRMDKAIERAVNYRFDKYGSFAVIAIEIGVSENIAKYPDEVNQHMTKATYLIDMICKDKSRPYLIAPKGQVINILLMYKAGEDSDKLIRNLSKIIYDILSTKMSVPTIKLGIGRTYRGIENVNKSLSDADKALFASKKYLQDPVVNFDNLGVFKIFGQDHLKDELTSFYEDTLKPLVEYDRKRDTELVKTLIVYFDNNGNLKKMSEDLFTHYNTVLYRINRIQEITKLELEKEEDRYALQTALKIIKVLNV